jgi:hypothetical protein
MDSVSYPQVYSERMADSSMVDKVADGMMARYPGFNPTPKQRVKMKAAMEAARPMTKDEAVKLGRILRGSDWWRARLACNLQTTQGEFTKE